MQLKEHDIRPAELDEGKIKALEEDLERLHANIDDFVEVNCPACSSSSSIFEFENMVLSLSDVLIAKLYT